MGFRITINGVALECDSLSDAVALVGNIVQAHPSQRAPHPRSARSPVATPAPATSEVDMHAARSWTPPERLRSFFDALVENERVALAALATCGGELSLDQLGHAAGHESTREASTMVGRVKRIALERGLEVSKLFSFRIAGARHERTSLYMAGPLLRGGAQGAE